MLFDQLGDYNLIPIVKISRIIDVVQAMNLSLSSNNLNVTERISQTTSITTALVNITGPTQELIYAEDINLAVDIMCTLNK